VVTVVWYQHYMMTSEVKLGKNPVSHKQSKHAEVRYYFVRVTRMVA